MSKFRIVQKDGLYAVEAKRWFGWDVLSEDAVCIDGLSLGMTEITFPSYCDAKQFIDNKAARWVQANEERLP